MPGGRIIVSPCDVSYAYDGGLAGFYCCVYASVYLRQMPIDIRADTAEQVSLLPPVRIETDADKARRVREGIRKKGSPRALELVETVFLSCLERKEIKILRFLLLAFEVGGRALGMLTNPDVAALLAAERHLLGEAHLLLGFLRFSDCEGKLVATIRPKNFILPFIAGHFASRYAEEALLIIDRTHGAALLYRAGHMEIVPAEEIGASAVSDEEERYRALWKRFYDTLSIEARYNPKCRMTHMPKRYWAEMTEMQDMV
ncbi:DNA metabolism protein [Clostridia bacterium]|nr:DNA metabolism protein [Clostridia bacterium]